MPEVGVLNLTIHDNSETAGQGLNALADALVRVKTALSGGLKLSGVATQVEKFSAAVSANSKALSASGTFLKAMSDYHKAFKDADKVKFNTQPIEALKSVIGEGIKIGQAGTQINKIREALGGEWNTDNSAKIKTVMQDIADGSKAIAGSNLGGTANNISKTAKALNEYADASERVKAALGKSESKWLDDAARRQKEWFEGGGFATGRPMPLNLQMFAYKKPAGDLGMDMDAMDRAMERTASQFAKTTNEIQSSTDAAREFIVQLREVGDTITSIRANPFEDMYRTFSMLSAELGWFSKESMRLMGGDSPLLLGDGKTPGQLLLGDGSEPKTFLSTWVDTGEQWKQNWVYYSEEAAEASRKYFSPDWIMDDSWKQQMYQRFVDMYNQFGWFASSGPMLESGNEPLKLYGQVQDTIDAQGTVDGVNTATTVVNDFKQTADEAKHSVDDFYNSLNKLELLKKLRGIITEKLAYGIARGTFDEEQVVNYEIRIANLTAQIDKLAEAERGASMEAINMAKDDISKYMDYSELELTRKKYDELTESIARQAAAGQLSESQFIDKIKTLQNLREKLEELEEAEARASSIGGRLGAAWDGLKNSIGRLFPTLTNLISRFRQIIKYRMIRNVIKHISSGFSEGLQNVYGYSKAIGGDFAKSMNSAATAINQMKNSIGASLAPVIQALIPYLNSVVNWFIEAVNYANQFFALLSGQNTWTRALPVATEAFDKQKKSAKGASSAMKDLLADWDELNIIQSKTGRGGSGTGTTPEEYKSMFEEVDKFNERVKEATGFIEEHLGGLPNLLKELGIILLGWKFSKAFTGILGKIGSIVAGLGAIKIGFELAYGSGFEAGKKGFFDTGDILGTIGGILASAIGGTLIMGPTGLIIGIGFGVMATITGWVKGQQDAADAAKWGNLHRSADEIEEFVRSQFTFDIVSEIDVIDGYISNDETARANLNREIDEFNKSLDQVKIVVSSEVDDSVKTRAVIEAAKEAQEAILAVNNLIDTHVDTITFTLGKFTFTDAEGNDVSGSLKDMVYNASEDVQSYFEGIGKKLAEYIKIGEQRELTSGEQEAALALMERARNILQMQEELSRGLNRRSEIMSGLGDITGKTLIEDRDTALAEIEREKELIEQYRSESEELVKQTVYDLNGLAAKAEAMAQDALAQGDIEAYNRMHGRYEELLEQIKLFDDPKYFQAQVDEDLKESIAIIRDYWSNLLKEVYGTDLDNLIFKGTSPFSHNIFGAEVASRFAEGLRFEDDKGAFIKKFIEINAGDFDSSGVWRSTVQDLGMNIWRDLMSEASKQNLYMHTADALGGNTKEATAAIMSAFGLSEEEVRPYLDYYMQYLTDEEKKAIENADFANAVKNEPVNFLAGLFDWLPVYKPPEVAEKPIDVQETFNIIPEVDIDSLYSDIREQILNSGIEDKKIPLGQIVDLWHGGDTDTLTKLKEQIDKYGVDEAFDRLTNYLQGDGWTVGKTLVPARVTASAGFNYSDSGFGGRSNDEPIQTEPKDPQAETNTVAAGVQKGTMDVVSAIRTLVPILTQILQKENTVVVAPGSDWGRHNAKSNSAWNKMTGTVAMEE